VSAEPSSDDPPRPALDRWFERVFGDDAPAHFGTGWASGVLSVFLGALGLLAVAVLWFPDELSTARFRPAYPLPLLRGLIEAGIAAAFVLGLVSLWLRRRKVLGATGVALALVGALLGGGRVTGRTVDDAGLTLGLDWFLLNLFLLALVFVPLERAFPRRPEQTSFRNGWTTDGLHFLVSHALVQALSFLILLPATRLTRLWQPEGLQARVGSWPFVFQLLAIVLVADLAQYAVHRAFHRVPLLWRFHAIHHSSVALDWLAGSRLHLADVVATRGLVLLPLVLLGFDQRPLEAYLVFVSFHAVFIHANLRLRLGTLERFLVTPRFHHWHHAAAPEARDRNFAVHLPWLDRLFGSAHEPPAGAWPESYGIPGHPVPPGYAAQLLYPLRPA
jgi:lathosterol oxidase